MGVETDATPAAKGSAMKAWSIVLAVAWATSACSDAIPIFTPPPDPELQVWFFESDAIPHDWMTVQIETRGQVLQVFGRDLTRHEGARAIYRSGALNLDAGKTVDVRFALVQPARDTLARWSFNYLTELNTRQVFMFEVRPDDPCPTFYCDGSEPMELPPRAGAAAGDRLWVKWYSICIDCRGAGIF